MNQIDTAKLAALRDRKEITQEAAASALGISRTTYISREKSGDFKEKEIEKICKLLRVSRAEIEREPGLPGSNSNDLFEIVKVIARVQKAQLELLLAVSNSLGKASHNKSVEILNKHGLGDILVEKGKGNI